MQTVYICFTNATHDQVGSYWSGPQDAEQLTAAGELAFPYYAELDSDDPRYAAWFAERLELLPSYITDGYVKPGA
ncbi:TPA: hypothetical protein ACKP22_000956 [Pseudomonas putida]